MYVFIFYTYLWFSRAMLTPSFDEPAIPVPTAHFFFFQLGIFLLFLLFFSISRGILYKHLQHDSLLTFKLCYDVYKTLFDGLQVTGTQRALPVKSISANSIFKQQDPELSAMIREFSSMIFWVTRRWPLFASVHACVLWEQ